MTSRKRYGLLAVLLGAALMLAGCGGDDGVSQGVHDQVQAELDQAQEDLMDAQEDLDQAQEDLADTQEDLDQAQEDLDQAQEDLADAQADDADDADAIDQAQEDLADTQEDLDQTQQDLADARDAAAAALKAEQDKASDAMDAAKMAADAAKMAADEAAAATMHLATMQTGAMSAMHAYNAKKYAMMAMDEYMKAKAASEAAMEAEDTATAALAAADAEAARMAAENAAMMVANDDMDGYADKAKMYAMMELKIDGTMKSVGDRMIDAAAPKTEVTSGSGDDAQTTITGLVGSPMTTGDATNGRAEVDASITANPEVPYVSPKVNAAERSGENGLKIGKDVDSADDMARLRIITAYADTQSVNVYDAGTTSHWSDKEGTVEVTSAGVALADATNLGDDGNEMLTLRPVGMFYAATGGTAGTLEPLGPTGAVPNLVQAGDTVAADVEAKPVYSFVNTLTDPVTTVYVVLDETVATTDNADDTDTTYEYLVVDIHHGVNQDGRDTGNHGGTAGDEAVLVTADLPVPKSYSHLHFGVWAGLGEAAKDGSQEISDLGIGFVQSIGDGMTADMPITGSATYNGNWTATVQEQDKGAIELETGEANLTANFAKDTLKADLVGLADLEGALTDSKFSGTKATVKAGNTYGLNANGTFTGTFSGAFYGDAAVEAGGIFDFTSEGIAHGAFRGAFGGRHMPEE